MKSLIEKAFFLKSLNLFNELELELLLAIAEKQHFDEYDADEKIFSCGQVANRIYFIINGEVEIFDSQGKIITSIGSLQFFGDESLFNEKPRSYSAICKKDTHLLSLSRSHLLSIISECPSVAVALLQTYSQKLPCRFQTKN